MLTPAPTSWTRGSITGPRKNGVSPIGITIASGPSAEYQDGETPKHCRKANRRHDDSNDWAADQRPQHSALDAKAERHHAAYRH